MSKQPKGLTRKELVKATGIPPYLIAYYTQCGYLPVIKQSTGPGNPIIYHPNAVRVVQERRGEKQSVVADTK